MNAPFSGLRIVTTPIVKPSKPVANEQIEGKFVMGPIPWSWLVKASQIDSRTVYIVLVIFFYKGVQKQKRFKISNKLLSELGINRQAKSRALKGLEDSGLIKIYPQKGGSPLVEIIDFQGNGVERGGDHSVVNIAKEELRMQ